MVGVGIAETGCQGLDGDPAVAECGVCGTQTMIGDEGDNLQPEFLLELFVEAAGRDFVFAGDFRQWHAGGPA